MSRPATTIADRFAARIGVRHDGCWEWLGARSDGYGRIQIAGRSCRTHRVAYEMFAGPIPEGMALDHLCRNRSCCNPAHLEVVTWGENNRRTAHYNALKTHCPNGHPYDEFNTYHHSDGSRECQVCKRARYLRSRRDRNKAV